MPLRQPNLLQIEMKQSSPWRDRIKMLHLSTLFPKVSTNHTTLLHEMRFSILYALSINHIWIQYPLYDKHLF